VPAFFGDTRLAAENSVGNNVIGRETRAGVCVVSAPRDDGHVYESVVAEGTAYGARKHGGCVPMRLDGNYPIGDADPLIPSSATPETPRSLATYESA